MTVISLTRDRTADAVPADVTGAGVPPARPLQFPLGWLRGIAALAVVTFHAYQHNRDPQTWAWPWSGTAHQLMLGTDLFVDMFFVLSGLVLWLPVALSCAAGEAGRPGRMLLLRRMARLLPLYYAIVLVVWAVTNPSLPGHWQDLLLHLTFTHVYSDQYIFWTDGPAWSLAVEFHFYLLMALAVPVVHRVTERLTTRRARLWAAAALPIACSVVAVGYLLWATVLSPHDATDWSIWVSPLS
jgi:peptidoglycan/LPS O-acetylase OafA/YrhL